MAPGEDINLLEENADKSKEGEVDVAREGSAELVSTNADTTAILTQPVLNEVEDITGREELENDIQSVDERSEAEETVSLEDTYGTNSESTFMIYDNLNEKFDQLENVFENKRDSVAEREAFDYDPLTGEITIIRKDIVQHELPSEIIKDVLDISKLDISTLDISTQHTYESESKAMVDEEISEVEDNTTAAKSPANNETENSKEEEMSIFTLLVAAYVIYCVLQLKCFQIFSFRI